MGTAWPFRHKLSMLVGDVRCWSPLSDRLTPFHLPKSCVESITPSYPMLSPGRTGDIKMNNLNFICQACHSRAGQPGEHATVTEQSWSRGVVTCCDKTHWPMAVILLRGVGVTSRVFAVIFFLSRLQTDADFQYLPSCCSMVRGKMQESWIEPASMGFTYFHSRCKIIINPCKIYTYNNRHTHTHTPLSVYIYIYYK